MTRITDKQFAVLEAMSRGAVLVWNAGTGLNPSEFLMTQGISHERVPLVRHGTSFKLADEGLIEQFSDKAWSWRNRDYRITEYGKEYVAKRTGSQS